MRSINSIHCRWVETNSDFPFRSRQVAKKRNRTAHAGKKNETKNRCCALGGDVRIGVGTGEQKQAPRDARRGYRRRRPAFSLVRSDRRRLGCSNLGRGRRDRLGGALPGRLRGNKTTLFPVLASREAPWRTRGTSTSRARYVVFTRASLRLMRLWTSARVVSRQRPSPTRRRTRFRRVSGTNASFRRSARTRAIGIDRDAIVRPRETSRLTSAIKTPKPPPYPTTGGAIVRHTAGGSRAGPTVRPRANRRGAPEPCFRRTSERVKSRESSSSSRLRRGHDPSFSLR